MCDNFIQKALDIKIDIKRKNISPVRCVRIEKDEKAYKGIGIEGVKPCNGENEISDYVCYDFAEHYVGNFSFDISGRDGVHDSPARLKITFAEVPFEFTDCPQTRRGWLSYSWIQEEYISVDVLPSHIDMPRRYAFRYVKIEVLAKNRKLKIVVSNPKLTAQTTASFDMPQVTKNEKWKEISQVSLRTLRDCMQSVFEDGPKRDRRLWIGDLRLQSLVNYDTFKNSDLVKKCLYLLAGLRGESGVIPACVYEKPAPHSGEIELCDFALFYTAVLSDYLDKTGDRETAQELFPAAYSQFELFEGLLDENYLVKPQEGWWCFVDWGKDIPVLLSVQAIAIYAYTYLKRLAQNLGKAEIAQKADTVQKKLFEALKSRFYNAESGLFEEDEALMWIPNIFLINSGLIEKEQGVNMVEQLRSRNDAILPVTPYNHHYLLEAYGKLGLLNYMEEHIEQYWGGMIKNGADTFWEIYKEDDAFFSPYDDSVLNSACHAWSCTPVYFIMKYLDKKED